MVSKPHPESIPVENDPLAERIREMWVEHDRLLAAGIDPDEEVDKMVEEVFGTPEAAQALLDWVLEDIYGKGWNDPAYQDDDGE